MMAVAPKLPVFVGRAPLDNRRLWCKASWRWDEDGRGSQALIHIRGRRSCKITHRSEEDGRVLQALSHIRGHHSCCVTHWSTGVRMMAVACKLPVICEAAAYVKSLTERRMRSQAPNLYPRALLDIRRPSCEATRRGEKDGCGSQAPSHIRGRHSCKGTHGREGDGRDSQAHSLSPPGVARYRPPVM